MCLSRFRDSPLDLLAECGGKPLDGRELRVGLPSFEARDRGLRRPHTSGHDRLRDAEFVALRHELSQQLPPAERCFNELGEVRVVLAALVDDLVNEVLPLHAPHYTVDGISLLRLASPAAANRRAVSWRATSVLAFFFKLALIGNHGRSRQPLRGGRQARSATSAASLV